MYWDTDNIGRDKCTECSGIRGQRLSVQRYRERYSTQELVSEICTVDTEDRSLE